MESLDDPPPPGAVLHYSFLWPHEAAVGREEGSKDRPAIVVAVRLIDTGATLVAVAPVTHRGDIEDSADAIEVPAKTKVRLGLDDAQSWIISSSLNEFTWPGHDVRAIPGSEPRRYSYGLIPPGLLVQIVRAIDRARDAGRIQPVNRD